MLRARVVIALLILIVSLVGCSDNDQGASAGPSTRTDRTTTRAEPGIGFDEAERESVLTGPFDAIALPNGGTAGRREFVLRATSGPSLTVTTWLPKGRTPLPNLAMLRSCRERR